MTGMKCCVVTPLSQEAWSPFLGQTSESICGQTYAVLTTIQSSRIIKAAHIVVSR